MPIARVRLSDGRIARLEVPEGTSEEDVIEFARKLEISSPSDNAAFQPKEPRSAIDYLTGAVAPAIGHGAARGLAGYADIEPLATNLIQAAKGVVGLEPKFQPMPATEAVDKYGDWPEEDGFTSLLRDVSTGVVGGASAGPVGAVAGGAAGGLMNIGQQIGAGPGLQALLGIGGGLAGGKLAAGKMANKAMVPSILRDVESSGPAETRAIGTLAKTINQQAVKLKTAENAAYEAAKPRAPYAFVDVKEIKQFAKDLQKNSDLEQDLDAKALMKSTANDLLRTVNKNKRMSVADMLTMRKSLSGISTSGGNKGYAAGSMYRQIDDILESPGVISGDKEAVSLSMDAIKKAREYRTKFKDPVEIARAIEDGQTTEAIESALLGGSGTVGVAKNASRIYDDVLAAMPEGKKQSAGAMMRMSVLNKMIKRSAIDDETLAARGLARQIKDLRVKNNSMWRRFSEDERNTLKSMESGLNEAADPHVMQRMGRALYMLSRKYIGYSQEIPSILQPDKAVSIKQLLEMTKQKPSYLGEMSFGAAMGTRPEEQEKNEVNIR